jgi:aspartate-semialdehyde dehydrogenase
MSLELKTGRMALVGASGAVGREMLSILAQAGVAAQDMHLFGSRSAGSSIPYGGSELVVADLAGNSFDDVDVVLFAAGADVAREWAPRAVDAGATVIDNSSAFRGDPDVPLVVPEVNPEALHSFVAPGIIANPNCSTIIALMGTAPIHRRAPITRMSIATYQAISGAGASAMSELDRQAVDHVAGDPLTVEALPSQALFNVFSHESRIGKDGFNEEEQKIRSESRRILAAPGLAISATCVRVGVPRAHAMAIDLDLSEPLDAADARALLQSAPGVTVVDDPEQGRFPESVHAAGGDNVLVGRIRNDPDRAPGRGLLLFACGDQLRKGAALNAIQVLALVSGE